MRGSRTLLLEGIIARGTNITLIAHGALVHDRLRSAGLRGSTRIWRPRPTLCDVASPLPNGTAASSKCHYKMGLRHPLWRNQRPDRKDLAIVWIGGGATIPGPSLVVARPASTVARQTNRSPAEGGWATCCLIPADGGWATFVVGDSCRFFVLLEPDVRLARQATSRSRERMADKHNDIPLRIDHLFVQICHGEKRFPLGRKTPGDRRIAGQGADDQQVPRQRLHRRGQHRPRPRPAPGGQGGAREVQEARTGPTWA